MPKFKSISAMANYIRKAIDSSLDNEVFEEVRNNEIAVIYDDVYGTVTPEKYVRRADNGGLSDEKNFVKVGDGAKNGVLIMENITPANPYLNGEDASDGISTTPAGARIDQLVVCGIKNKRGYGYDYWKNVHARDFIDGTTRMLESTGYHVLALKEGLEKRGISVK